MGDLLSPMHIIVLLVVALLIFGPKRLPEIGSGLGKSIREFKASMTQAGDNAKTDMTSQEYPVQAVVRDDSQTPQ